MGIMRRCSKEKFCESFLPTCDCRPQPKRSRRERERERDRERERERRESECVYVRACTCMYEYKREEIQRYGTLTKQAAPTHVHMYIHNHFRQGHAQYTQNTDT
jgi:hypothetical protein